MLSKNDCHPEPEIGALLRQTESKDLWLHFDTYRSNLWLKTLPRMSSDLEANTFAENRFSGKNGQP